MACAVDMNTDIREPRHINTQQDTVMDIRVIGCRLVWQVETMAEGDITLFLVSSEDRSGRFYHLATVRHNYVDLVPGMLTKTQRFIILVIGEDGIRHRQHLEVAGDNRDCDHGMKDTLTISEEQARLQKENSTLLRALSNLTTSKEKPAA